MIDLVKLHQAATHAQVEGYLLKWSGSEIRQLVDQLQAAQKDASRWRQATRNYEIQDVAVVVYDKYGHEMLVMEDEADAAIDAAMAATKGEQA